MDFIGKTCPVCSKAFASGDDIVVCPECGTPHHRSCYELKGKCANSDKHDTGFVYNEEKKSADDDIVCKRCGTHNDKSSVFCKRCGASLSGEEFRSSPPPFSNAAGFSGNQFSDAQFQNLLDPLGGVDKAADIGDGVTAGEAAKYVKQNSPYFVRVFYNIKNFSRSKFNFSAAVFSGGYLLYRKMYKAGAVIIAIQFAMLALLTYISYSSDFSTTYSQLQKILATASTVGSTQASLDILNYMSTLTASQVFMIVFPVIYDVMHIVTMIVMGTCVNRFYYNHCIKSISKIKAESETGEIADSALQTKGGVNVAIAITMLVSYMIINYLPAILYNFL